MSVVMPAVRSIGAVLAGLIIGVTLIGGVEALCSWLYPLPPGVGPSDTESLRAFIAALPKGAFILVLVGWAAGSFAGSFVATRLAGGRRAAHGVLVGILFLAAGVWNMFILPHPAWFWLTALLIFPLFTHFGARAAGERH